MALNLLLPHDGKEVDPTAPGGELDVTKHGENVSGKGAKTMMEPPPAPEQPALV